MQTKAILATLFAVIPFICASPWTTSISPEQSSKISSDLVAYWNSLRTQPAYTSVVSVMATGLPASVIQEMEDNPDAFLDEFVTAKKCWPSYFTPLPSDVQRYLCSVGVAGGEIIRNDLTAAAAPTDRVVKMMGGAAAAGVVGLALL